MKKELIVLGADHGGFRLKQTIKRFFIEQEYDIIDTSPSKVPGDDYPDYALKVSDIVKKKRNYIGVLICKTGTGMAMAANKVSGIRAVLAHDEHSAKMARKDENANVLCLPGNYKDKDAIKFTKIFLKTKFSGQTRHKRRIRKLANILDLNKKFDSNKK